MPRTITRRMTAVEDSFLKEIRGARSRHNLNNLMSRIRFEEDTGARKFLAGRLINMLRECGIECDGHVFEDEELMEQDTAYIESLLKNVSFETSGDVLSALIDKVTESIEQSPVPGDYLERLVDHICGSEWAGDSLRLRILKRFVKYGKGSIFNAPNAANPGAGYGAAARKYLQEFAQANAGDKVKIGNRDFDLMADNLTEEVFDVLGDENVSKEKYAFGGAFGLIKAVDDLANGLFRSGGSTKRDLFLFAMVFDMTFYYKDPVYASIRDDYTDVEKNLFESYYQNNLKRFLNIKHRTGGDWKINTAYDLVPSGIGINYKNFAELTYIYYISRRDMAPDEKISRSAHMIQRLRTAAPSVKDLKGTVDSRDMFIEDILIGSSDEESFFKFVSENILTPGEVENIGPLQYGVISERAVAEYNAIVKRVKDELASGEKVDLHQGHYLTELCEKKGPAFAFLLDQLDRILKEDFVTDPEKITRSHLVAAYYEYFILSMSNDNSTLFDFKDVYQWFCAGADAHLEKAGYPPVSPKNIFDLLVIASAYSYLAI